jgi:hypothetical protein
MSVRKLKKAPPGQLAPYTVIRERIRQIEAKAISKLRHHSRGKDQNVFVENAPKHDEFTKIS